jgi:hypothetical protein
VLIFKYIFLSSPEKKITSYEDFCHGVAVIWSFVTKYWIKLKNLKQENTHKVLCSRWHLLKLLFPNRMFTRLLIYYNFSIISQLKAQGPNPFICLDSDPNTVSKRYFYFNVCQLEVLSENIDWTMRNRCHFLSILLSFKQFFLEFFCFFGVLPRTTSVESVFKKHRFFSCC